MKKPFWLKKSSLQYYLVNFLFDLYSILVIPKGEKNKVLVTEFDGIGDVVVNQKLIELIMNKYGKEQVIFLIRDNMVDLAVLMQYNYMTYEDNYHLNIFKLVRLYKKMSKYNFRELYFLEFHLGYDVNKLKYSDKEYKISFLKKFKFKKIYGYRNGIFDSWLIENNITVIDSSGEKILDKVYNYAKVIDNKIEIEEMIPNLEINKLEMNYISVGIGASDKIRIPAPEKLAEFLNYISQKEECYFYILGYGKTQNEYFKKLEKFIDKKERLINYVGKLSLMESIEKIANSKLYIGFDSGLYNIAYALKKNIIAITDEKICPEYRHESKNIKFVHKKEGEESFRIEDLEYKNENLNSISINAFIREYESF